MVSIRIIKQDEIKKEDDDKGKTNKPNEPNSGFKLYKRRWLVLLISLGFDIFGAFRAWRFPLVTVAYPYWDSNATQINNLSLLPLMANFMFVIPLSRLLDKYGLRFMTLLMGSFLVISGILQTLVLINDEYWPYFSVPVHSRLIIYIISNILFLCCFSGFPGIGPRIAKDWFPSEQMTFVLSISAVVNNIVTIITSFFAPRIVKNQDDLRYIGYVMLALCGLYGLIMTFCIKDSRPPSPPSKLAQEERPNVEPPPMMSYITILKKQRSTMVWILGSSFCIQTAIIIKGIYGEVLNMRGYSQEFAGDIASISSISIGIGSLLASTFERWLGLKRLVRVCTLIIGVFFCIHNLSQLTPGMEELIIASNIINSIPVGMLIPVGPKLLLGSAGGVLPDASLIGLSSFIGLTIYIILSLALGIINGLSSESNVHVGPYYLFAFIVLLGNLAIAFLFDFTPFEGEIEPRNVDNQGQDNNQNANSTTGLSSLSLTLQDGEEWPSDNHDNKT